MMDRNDTTAESLILIDWDLTQYGYRQSFTKITIDKDSSLKSIACNSADSDFSNLQKSF